MGILDRLRRLLGSERRQAPEVSQEEVERHYDAKKAALENVLGPMHDMVGHSIIPFELGGAVDMYYFLEATKGTACATMELIAPDGTGPLPTSIGTYELVAFTRASYPATGDDPETEGFDEAASRLCGIFTGVGRYSFEARLEPGDTCELPREDEPSICLLFDHYGRLAIDGGEHGLLLCLEVFRSEMEYARANGSAALFDRLRSAGHYPFSDLNRPAVA